MYPEGFKDALWAVKDSDTAFRIDPFADLGYGLWLADCPLFDIEDGIGNRAVITPIDLSIYHTLMLYVIFNMTADRGQARGIILPHGQISTSSQTRSLLIRTLRTALKFPTTLASITSGKVMEYAGFRIENLYHFDGI